MFFHSSYLKWKSEELVFNCVELDEVILKTVLIYISLFLKRYFSYASILIHKMASPVKIELPLIFGVFNCKFFIDL